MKTIRAFDLITKTWTYHNNYGYGCAECCTGDRCDDDCDAKYKGRRDICPHCKGEGWISIKDLSNQKDKQSIKL